MQKNIVFKAYCPTCKRFLFKYVYPTEFSIFYKCVGCKNVSSFIIKDRVISTATLGSDFNVEPEGVVSESDLEFIFNCGRKHDLQ